jgi:hypothetical protein
VNPVPLELDAADLEVLLAVLPDPDQMPRRAALVTYYLRSQLGVARKRAA